MDDDWRGVLVVVQAGDVELHCHRGGRRAFGAGSIVWFDGLGLRFLRNPGPAEVVLVAFARPRSRPI